MGTVRKWVFYIYPNKREVKKYMWIALENMIDLFNFIVNMSVEILPYIVWFWIFMYANIFASNIFWNYNGWLTGNLIYDEVAPIKNEVKKITPLDEAIQDTQKIMDYTKEIKKIQKKYKKPFWKTIFTINK